ncbi:carcinoembryonic antigen-related cell adhesion molecule 1-like isoform X1 [Ctenopharyngodon idella]|uniref:carcinoembryonic antigen-related cell adhesion molecule 1-like isoform X1 n=1 Tax=Ctenopharyngodon idella TaxID=7959 RepID=UPI002231243C|nr:carcinoembryonic antigen-related cell adhesion molecule 1-like isoform X1 [Ctenopharyngodon idella]
MKLKLLLCFPLLLWCLLDHGVFGVDSDEVSVMEGDSVTLHTGVQTNQQERIRWYFNDTRIAQINGEQSKTCTDVQCNGGTERFRDRLKLDHQTGSLTITNTRNTDAGVYRLKISSGRSESEKIFSVTIRDGVFVMEGDSVTLNTGVQTDQQDRIRWYFNDTLITQFNGKSETCTDVQCDEGNERFRGRLKLDHQTGSLTITNITNTHSGVYNLKIISSGSSDSEHVFSVTVIGVSAAEQNKMKRKSLKEGESVTLDPGEVRKPKDMMWYFNDTLIAEITGDQSKICTDDQCDERFRDRLKVNQTGSLTITNTRNTDSGEYKLWINSSRFSIIRSFSVSVTAVPDSGLSPGAVAGIVVFLLLLLLAAVGLVFYRHWRSRKQGNRTAGDDQENEEGVALEDI